MTASLMFGVFVWNVTPLVETQWSLHTMEPEALRQREQSVYYSNCSAARAAGAAPIYRGSPGYRAEMDGDSDGIACEPY